MKYQNSWHLLSSSDTIEKLSSDMYKGLTEQEVVKRRNSSGINDVWQVSHTSFVKKILESVFDLSTLLAALIVVISALLLPDKMTAVVMGIIVIICVVTKTIISFLSQKMIERSFECKIPQATVIREGKIRILPASELVVGDVVFLEKGDTVPADGRVISGYDSIVSERGITSNKTEKEFQQLCEHLDILPSHLLMIGNSLKSDIAPALNIGASAIHIPFHVTWQLEHFEDIKHERLVKITHFNEILKLL